MAKAKKLIVGIDPGTSTSFAIFDLSGNLIVAETMRNPGMERVIEEILKYGIPVVVATDMHSSPEFVTQIASSFNARLFAPEKDMLQRDKEELTHELELENAHERDAAASAINFIHHYKNKMAWINRNIDERGLTELSDEIKTYVLQGVQLERVMSYLAMDKEISNEETEGKGKLKAEAIEKRKQERSEIKELIESNAQLRSLLSVIWAENRLMKDRLKVLEKESKPEIKRDKLLESREMQINRLKALLERQTREISRLEQSLKTLKRNSEAVGKERPPKKELEKKDMKKEELEREELEQLIDIYREEKGR